MDKFCYKNLEIDFDSLLISKAGEVYPLDPKAFKTLALLVENKHRVVSTDELLNDVWNNKKINNEVVTAAIGRLRKLFKDAGVKSEVIRTAHKVGYQFVLEEHLTDDSHEPFIVSDNNKTENRLSTLSKINLVLFFILLGALALLTRYLVNNKEMLQPNSVIKSEHQLVLNEGAHSSKPTEIFFIRHADKESDGTDDPPLSALGIARANRWRTLFSNIKFDEIYTTRFIRNTQTVDEVFGKNLDNVHYYSALSFDIVEKAKGFSGKKVAIIAHSNTIPSMVNSLVSDRQYQAMDHQNYNLIYQIIIDSTGAVSSNQFILDYALQQ